ncbi:MAG: hypothetical protein KF699_12265 [Phycisphaeraceae bacterium]|nr:hypothetical protein [Phycisphaeraceae bacterium]
MAEQFGLTKPQIYAMSAATQAKVTLYYVDASGVVVDVIEVVPLMLWLQARHIPKAVD